MSKPTKQDSQEKESYEEKKERDKTIRKLQKEISNSEKKIERLEKEVAEIEAKIAENAADNPQDLYQKHADKSRELENIMSAWEKQELELENLQS